MVLYEGSVASVESAGSDRALIGSQPSRRCHCHCSMLYNHVACSVALQPTAQLDARSVTTISEIHIGPILAYPSHFLSAGFGTRLSRCGWHLRSSWRRMFGLRRMSMENGARLQPATRRLRPHISDHNAFISPKRRPQRRARSRKFGERNRSGRRRALPRWEARGSLLEQNAVFDANRSRCILK